ncbi:serine hydrolase [Anabaena cylindrica FACHB-243]|uniref:Beta-lactamase n=1 Tax=Anabaena cylindrica (strain ATCC 27899 / PCC 7122) TaxID=272123 RepID=K9ZDS1_ANACC|nr:MULTISPECIES: serine hydrolase [Anabaena]AFZ57331.1 beta-lactamase [Anabaena cylindrica PCC 7122]MBD2420999.1 serine hydrolase [Anabaena cylindrica FACHB-243]MBY5280703.1 serine hydrolase [Anabaena sp. CCAP 1446/1C]MBY5306911.1 serine hydrolase [Anabaena sp. CCAP 1446/1C]MCM2405752.1 serine hydrolase [Anabaena sp. CCAP 1446/1C]
MQLTHKTNLFQASWLLSSFLSVFLFGSTVKAATIASWYFDSNRNHLKFSTDEQVQPQVQLANPNRLVIDLPGVTLGYSPVSQRVGVIIREVKIAQVNPGNTRIVVTLAPGYTFDPAQVKLQQESVNNWSVQLPKPIKQNLSRLNRPQIQVSPTVKKSANLSVRLPKPITRLNTPEIKASPNLSESKLFAGVVPLHSPMKGLEPQIKALMNRYSFLQTGMFFLDLDNGDYLDIGGDRVFPAASTIKLPILLAFFQELDAGRVSLDDKLTMRRDLVTNGSGVMQYERVGKKYTALETITKMIVISDNTATNMIIDRLGGAAKLNGRFRSWGLKNTVIRHLLGDFKGTNTTSSQDMARALALLVNDKLVSSQSKEQALDILRHTKTRTLLPAGLGKGAIIAHKTGDIGFLIGNAGFVTMPNGKHYLAAIFVKRPYKDVRGREFIREVSRLVYDYLNQQIPVASLDSDHSFTR